jgi:integrase
MASIWKHPESQFWTGCYTAADGRQLKRSTRTTDKRKALAIAQAWEEVEGMGARGFLSSDEQLRRVLNQTFTRITGKAVAFPSVREWFDRWLRIEQGAVASETYKRYSQVLRDFLAHLGTRADVRLEAITTDDFLGFRDKLLAEGRSERTVNNVVRKILKRPFTVAFNEGILSRNPVAAVRHLQGQNAEKGVFTPEEIVRLITTAESLKNEQDEETQALAREWTLLILLGYYVGGRLMDLVRLNWGQVDVDERSIIFIQEKTGAKIKVPIHPELADHLLSDSVSVPDDDALPLLPVLSATPGGGKTGLSSRFKNLMKSAGIADGVARVRKGSKGRTTARLSFHSLRHSFVSGLSNAGVPSDVRQKLSGHADERAHQVYSHHEFETIRRALGALPRLPKGEGAK